MKLFLIWLHTISIWFICAALYSLTYHAFKKRYFGVAVLTLFLLIFGQIGALGLLVTALKY